MDDHTNNFKIDEREVGQGQPALIIAELSGNHNGSFEKAKEMVKEACLAGADIIKLQTYTADTMTIDLNEKWFQVNVNPAWNGKTLHQLYGEAFTPWEWHGELEQIAKSYGKPLFSTPFDTTAVDFLEKMNTPSYKIASFEIVDIELLKRVAQTKKPVIMSRGMASLEEMELAVKTLRENGTKDLAILQCVSSYPALPEELNLKMIPDISEKFKVVSGLSDHSLSITVPAVAVALGASIIEKHFIINRKEGGPDAGFSLEPAEFKEMVKQVREAEKAIGKVQYGAGEREKENIVFRRSLFVVEDIKKGEEFTRQNV